MRRIAAGLRTQRQVIGVLDHRKMSDCEEEFLLTARLAVTVALAARQGTMFPKID